MTNTSLGALWMVGAVVSFTIMAIAGRVASVELDTFEIMLFRSLTGILIVFAVAGYAGTLRQFSTQRWPLHAVRNIAHFTGQNLWFFAITVLPLAQVFALEFTTPIWVILLAPLLLRERLSLIGVLCALAGFVGVLIVTRPGATSLGPGVYAAAGAAVAFALTAIFTRKLTRTDSITTILIYLTCFQAVFGLVCAGYDSDIALPSLHLVPAVVLIGISGLLAHFCMTNALAIAPASFVMPIDFARLPIIAIVGFVVYDEPLDALVFLGAAVIFAANYVNIIAAKRG